MFRNYLTLIPHNCDHFRPTAFTLTCNNVYKLANVCTSVSKTGNSFWLVFGRIPNCCLPVEHR